MQARMQDDVVPGAAKASKQDKWEQDYQHTRSLLQQWHTWRYNDVTATVEYQDDKHNWLELDKYRLNSLLCRLRNHAIRATDTGVMELLMSDFVTKVHPIKDYFRQLPQWDGRDYIAEVLAPTVPVGRSDCWPEYLTRWLIGVVAQVLDPKPTRAQNQLCLTLSGSQGSGKTTWLNNLCPPDLRDYMFSGRLDMANEKDGVIQMAQCFLINIDDQLAELTRKNTEQIKAMITLPEVKVRRPYDRNVSRLPRICSYMGSINDRSFLADMTGNRRFLCFEVVGDIGQEDLDYTALWSQVYGLYLLQYRYYFTKGELTQLEELNEQFRAEAPELELLRQYYEPVAEEDEDTFNQQRMTAAQITQELSFHAPSLRLSPTMVGKFLQSEGYLQKKNGRGLRQYVVRPIPKDPPITPKF